MLRKLIRGAFFAPAHGTNPDTETLCKANRLTMTRQLHLPNPRSIVEDTAPFDGRQIRTLSMGHEATDGQQVAFVADFDDGLQGLYVATVCVPSPVIGDLDDDGFVTLSDSPLFIATLLNPAGAAADDVCAADTNIDGWIDSRDVQIMVNLIVTD